MERYAAKCDYDYKQDVREHQNLNSTLDYFRLSLSWSPIFCKGKRNVNDLFQCQHVFGFIVHGLWPYFDEVILRSDPRNCRNEKQNSSDIDREIFLFDAIGTTDAP